MYYINEIDEINFQFKLLDLKEELEHYEKYYIANIDLVLESWAWKDYYKIDKSEVIKNILKMKDIVDKTKIDFDIQKVSDLEDSNKDKVKKNSTYIKKQLKKAFDYIDFSESNELEKELGENYYSIQMFNDVIVKNIELSMKKVYSQTSEEMCILELKKITQGIEKLLELDNIIAYALAREIIKTLSSAISWARGSLDNKLGKYYFIMAQPYFYEMLGEKTKENIFFLTYNPRY